MLHAAKWSWSDTSAALSCLLASSKSGQCPETTWPEELGSSIVCLLMAITIGAFLKSTLRAEPGSKRLGPGLDYAKPEIGLHADQGHDVAAAESNFLDSLFDTRQLEADLNLRMKQVDTSAHEISPQAEKRPTLQSKDLALRLLLLQDWHALSNAAQ